MKKVVFITNILRQPRCIRRIKDFISRGYDIKVYGFDRQDDNRALPNFDYQCIGVNSNSESYVSRLFKMRNSISAIINREGIDCTYYIFSLDVAIASLAAKRKIKFCYEISDLMELQVKNKLISSILVRLNRWIISQSVLNVYTSEGFVDYLSPKGACSDRTVVLPNKLNREISKLKDFNRKSIDINNIRFGFTGAIRTETIYNFIDAVGQLGKHEVHLYGIFTDEGNGRYSIKSLVDKYSNVFYHGVFKNPDDFPEIYSNFDLVLCYYYSSKNDIYLEPNKLYEAIYFRCPIVVSDGTFVGKKVSETNIGYVIPAKCKNSLVDFIDSINETTYYEKLEALNIIPKENALDDSKPLFKMMDSILKK